MDKLGTPTAWQILYDCKLSLQLLETEQRPDVWRLYLIANITLLRTIGHVLEKIDLPGNTILKTLYKEWTKESENQHKIFRSFIKKERDAILKEYSINLMNDDQISLLFNDGNFDILSIGYKPMLEGDYSGEDIRDIIKQAIQWWEKQLTRINTYQADI